MNLENAELSPCALSRALWQMRLAHWFDNATGIVFGRNNGPDSNNTSEMSYLEALKQCTEGLVGKKRLPEEHFVLEMRRSATLNMNRLLPESLIRLGGD